MSPRKFSISNSSWAVLGLYAAALWLSISLLGYGLGLRDFVNVPAQVLSSGGQHLTGPITALSESGFGRNTHYRLRVQHSEELAIPPEIAFPLWPGNAEPNRYLSDFLHEGQAVTIATTGGPFPVVLALILSGADGKQEKILDAENSVSRYGAVQVDMDLKATFYEIFGALLLPLVFGLRFGWARMRRSAGNN